MAASSGEDETSTDPSEVARYTLNKWGKHMLQEYRDGLKDTFKRIGNSEPGKRVFSKKFPEVFVTKYKYHYIFYLTENLESPIIVGIIHERRDIVNRLTERLS